MISVRFCVIYSLSSFFCLSFVFFFFKQKTAYEMRISDWSSDVCSSDLDYRSGRSPRAPFGVEAVDGAGDHVRLVYFGRTSGLARKLFPLGEARRVSGRLDLYGDMRQIVHPDQVAEQGDEAAIALHGIGRAHV